MDLFLLVVFTMVIALALKSALGKSDYDKVKEEREKNDMKEALKSIRERQEEARMFGGVWSLSGSVFPTKEKERQYYSYLHKKKMQEIKESNPEFYEAMSRINDGYPLVLDTQKKTFYSEGYVDDQNKSKTKPTPTQEAKD